MKIRILLFCSLLLFLIFNSRSPAYAHPGGTDSSGGHTCRTNCEDWGLQYGEYHYHNTENSNEDSYNEDIYEEGTYDEGYIEGYDYAYSYTSVCEEVYEWEWEGSQDFGNGYDDGINDGHYKGLEVCFENSYQVGYDIGYDDYENGNDYNEEPVDDQQQIDITSYGKGYSKGYVDAEGEIVDKDSTETDLEASISASSEDDSGEETDGKHYAEEDFSYDDAYDEGNEVAKKGYIYDENNFNLKEDQQDIYRSGYRAGWIAGGGGTVFEQVWFYLVEKFPYITFPVSSGVVFFLAWIIKRRNNKVFDPGIWCRSVPWILSVIGILFIVMWIRPLLNSETEPTISVYKEEGNPYSYTTEDYDCSEFDNQEDAQLFYEANGGPDEGLHDLDRDGDGMACEWD